MRKWVLYSLLLCFTAIVCSLSDPGPAQGAPEYGYYTNAKVHPEVPRINAFVVKKLFDQGKIIVANAMEKANYEADRLSGSISLPPDALPRDLPKSILIAIYCN